MRTLLAFCYTNSFITRLNLTNHTLFKRYLNNKIDYSLVPKLIEEDLEEKLVSGHGPGGSKVNRSLNACFLKHIPTGLHVKVHQAREAHKNCKIARELLTLKLDEYLNGEKSVIAQKARLINEKGKKQETQASKRREQRLKFKESLAVLNLEPGEK